MAGEGPLGTALAQVPLHHLERCLEVGVEQRTFHPRHVAVNPLLPACVDDEHGDELPCVGQHQRAAAPRQHHRLRYVADRRPSAVPMLQQRTRRSHLTLHGSCSAFRGDGAGPGAGRARWWSLGSLRPLPDAACGHGEDGYRARGVEQLPRRRIQRRGRVLGVVKHLVEDVPLCFSLLPRAASQTHTGRQRDVLLAGQFGECLELLDVVPRARVGPHHPVHTRERRHSVVGRPHLTVHEPAVNQILKVPAQTTLHGRQILGGQRLQSGGVAVVDSGAVWGHGAVDDVVRIAHCGGASSQGNAVDTGLEMVTVLTPGGCQRPTAGGR
mmetsp:Transcript_11247/g.32631  ORF Transcript_11247/g.32631 Transcript_11247/m.32631 type:complete len:326 (+) Transcript_11247:1171-2148(+)